MVSHQLVAHQRLVAIFPVTQHHKAAFRGNWLLVYVNPCCHVLFTPRAGETFAPANRFHMLPLSPARQRGNSRADSAATSDALRKSLHILSFLIPCLHLPVCVGIRWHFIAAGPSHLCEHTHCWNRSSNRCYLPLRRSCAVIYDTSPVPQFVRQNYANHNLLNLPRVGPHEAVRI